MSGFVLAERTGAIVTLTLNRPEQRNAISEAEQIEDLVAACESVARDHTVACVILTGAGKSFSAGGNVKAMHERSGFAAGSGVELRLRYDEGIQRIPVALYGLEVPTIAAVNGHAIGLGCDLACMCDIRIAADDAVFAESFVKLGIIPGDGGAWFLPRIVGLSKAAEMTFTGDSVDATEALRCGLVSRVVPRETLLDEALALAGRIATNPLPAVRMSKRLLREGQHVRLDTLLAMSAAFQALAHHTEDHHEAVTAFLEKRAPRYTGR